MFSPCSIPKYANSPIEPLLSIIWIILYWALDLPRNVFAHFGNSGISLALKIPNNSSKWETYILFVMAHSFNCRVSGWTSATFSSFSRPCWSKFSSNSSASSGESSDSEVSSQLEVPEFSTSAFDELDSLVEWSFNSSEFLGEPPFSLLSITKQYNYSTLSEFDIFSNYSFRKKNRILIKVIFKYIFTVWINIDWLPLKNNNHFSFKIF